MPVFGKKHKIIGIADVVSHFELVLHELVKLVHVDVHQELGGEVAEWEPDTRLSFSMKTINYSFE